MQLSALDVVCVCSCCCLCLLLLSTLAVACVCSCCCLCLLLLLPVSAVARIFYALCVYECTLFLCWYYLCKLLPVFAVVKAMGLCMCLPPSVVTSVSCLQIYMFVCACYPRCCLFLLLPASATCIYYCLCLLVGLLGPVSAVVLFYIACLLPVYFLTVYSFVYLLLPVSSLVKTIARVSCCLYWGLPESASACVYYCQCLL